MSFELAAVIVVALIAVGLALTCYHLLGRLEMLERAVQGGMGPPSTRLSREQFERRFRTAHARSGLAREIGTGVLLVVGSEHRGDSELASTIEHLNRNDLLDVRDVEEIEGELLGISTTPFLFVVDAGCVRSAQPVASTTDVIRALEQFA